MKISIRSLALAFAVSVAFASQTMFAQTAVESTTTTTTNSAGTITEFSPDAIVIKTESATEPVHYTYTKTTTYVDENGNAVSMDVVKSGVPVTVYYTKDGDKMVATKVVVRRTTTEGGTTVDKKTTTTTTTDK